MTDQPHDDRKSAFARSIDALFHTTEADGEAAEPSTGVSATDVPAGEEHERGASPSPMGEDGPGSSDEVDAGLRIAVAAYLKSDVRNREVSTGAVRHTFAQARRADRRDAMCDAVSALARLGGSRPDALALTRELMFPGLAALLVKRMLETPPSARADRIELLRQLGEPAVRAVADHLHDKDEGAHRRVLLETLVEIGPGAPEVIEEMVEDGRWFVVRNAVTVLGAAGGDIALQHLTGTTVHPDPRVRRETVNALQKVQGEGAGVLILGRLEDEDGSVRMAAARAVGALGLDRGVRRLMALLEDENDDDVIAAACRALGSFGDPVAVPALEKRATSSFFSRPSTAVRIAAYQGLAAIGTPHALSLVESATEDRDPQVRAAATLALRHRED